MRGDGGRRRWAVGRGAQSGVGERNLNGEDWRSPQNSTSGDSQRPPEGPFGPNVSRHSASLSPRSWKSWGKTSWRVRLRGQPQLAAMLCNYSGGDLLCKTRWRAPHAQCLGRASRAADRLSLSPSAPSSGRCLWFFWDPRSSGPGLCVPTRRGSLRRRSLGRPSTPDCPALRRVRARAPCRAMQGRIRRRRRGQSTGRRGGELGGSGGPRGVRDVASDFGPRGEGARRVATPPEDAPAP